MKPFAQAKRNRKGFTLIELLVVIALLGVLAAVAVPNVGKFMGKGKTEAKAAELHNIQTGVMALMADTHAGALETAADMTSITDLSTIEAIDTTVTPNVTKNLSEYVTGLNADFTVKTGATYTFTTDGTVTTP